MSDGLFGSLARRFAHLGPQKQEEPPSPLQVLARKRKDEEREKKAMRQKEIDDCGKDGGHVYTAGRCVGCGATYDF